MMRVKDRALRQEFFLSYAESLFLGGEPDEHVYYVIFVAYAPLFIRVDVQVFEGEGVE